MKVLIVSDVFPPKCGGVGWGAFYLAKALQKEGHSVTVATVLGQADEYKGLKILRCPPGISREFAHRKLRKFLKGLLKKEKFDVINPHHIIAVRASVGLNVPVMATVNDYWPICYKGTLFNSHLKTHYTHQTLIECFKSVFYENRLIIKLLSPIITSYMMYRTWASRKDLQKAQAVSFPSKDTVERLSPYTPNKPVGITYQICVSNVDYEKVNAKKFDKPTILFVGKFNPNKGATVIPKIAKLVPEADFLLIGGKKEELKQDIPENVKVLSYIPNDEVYSYMKGCDIYIAPALWHEPLGRIVVEAIAMGAPVMISARGGMQSDIIDHNKNGIIVDPLTPENFAKEIKKLLADKSKLEQFSKEARKKYEKCFSEKVILKQFLDMYVKAINDKKDA